MHFKYGVSFNCNVFGGNERNEVGGGEEGDISIDCVGNDLEKIEQHLTKDDPSYFMTTDHEYIGRGTDVGGDVVAVVCGREPDDYVHIVCVVFEDPSTIEVID